MFRKRTTSEAPIKECGVCGMYHETKYFYEGEGEHGLALCSEKCAKEWVHNHNGRKPLPPGPPCRTIVTGLFVNKSSIKTWEEEVYEQSKELYKNL